MDAGEGTGLSGAGWTGGFEVDDMDAGTEFGISGRISRFFAAEPLFQSSHFYAKHSLEQAFKATMPSTCNRNPYNL